MQTKAPKSTPKNKPITVIGIVVPVMWDVEGNPIRVALSTNEEQQYVIDRRNRIGKEVANLLRVQVQVEGSINESGAMIVRKYARVEWEGF